MGLALADHQNHSFLDWRMHQTLESSYTISAGRRMLTAVRPEALSFPLSPERISALQAVSALIWVGGEALLHRHREA